MGHLIFLRHWPEATQTTEAWESFAKLLLGSLRFLNTKFGTFKSKTHTLPTETKISVGFRTNGRRNSSDRARSDPKFSKSATARVHPA